MNEIIDEKPDDAEMAVEEDDLMLDHDVQSLLLALRYNVEEVLRDILLNSLCGLND
jgi:hypothetical protein